MERIPLETTGLALLASRCVCRSTRSTVSCGRSLPACPSDLPFLAETMVPREVNGWTLATNSRSYGLDSE